MTDCNPHPDAPHGFCRDDSHTADEYVCECHGWQPEVNPARDDFEEAFAGVDLTFKHNHYFQISTQELWDEFQEAWNASAKFHKEKIITLKNQLATNKTDFGDIVNYAHKTDFVTSIAEKAIARNKDLIGGLPHNDFDSAVAELKAKTEVINDLLWAVQLEHYSSSVRLSNEEARNKWLGGQPTVKFIQHMGEQFDVENFLLNKETQVYARDRTEFINAKWAHEKYIRAYTMNLCSQFNGVGFFYECGHDSIINGPYKGYRYGAEGHEYMSSFGQY